MPSAKRPAPAAPLPVAGTPLTARASARRSTPAQARTLTPAATTQLERLRAEEARLETLLETAPELPEVSAGGDDVHLVAEALVADNAQKSFYVRQLEDVRTSISAIGRGSYGTCTGCGKPIPKARLEVMPDATKCVPCASARR
jgi:RNA polymerase-binding transcription factor DksA